MSEEPEPRRRCPSWPVLATAAVVLVVAVAIAAQVSPDIPFDSDEANHANLGLRQYQDLAGGDLLDFVRHSYRTGQFPFLHGWMQLPSFALFGPTAWAARVAQVGLFVLGCVATGWAAYRASDDDPRAGCVGALLFALAPKFAAMAGLCMLEVPGAAMTALSLAVFAEAMRRDAPGSSARRVWLWHVGVAATVLATYFTKLNFGLWIAPAIFAGYAATALDRERRGRMLRAAAVYLGVLIVVALIWYSTAAQRAAFLGFLTNPAEKVAVEVDDPTFHLPRVSWDNFTAYFTLIPEHFHLHWVLGWTVFVAFAVGLVRRDLLRRPLVVAAAACVLWTWFVLSMAFRQYAFPRFIATALPPLWIVAAGPLARAAAWCTRFRFGDAALGALVLVALGAQLVRLPSGLTVEYEVGAQVRPLFDFVAETVPARSSVAVVNYTDHTSARTLVWELSCRPGRTYRDHDVKAYIGERVFESDQRLRDWFEDPRPWGADDWHSYVVEIVPGPTYIDHEIVVPETIAMWHGLLLGLGDRLERVASRHFDGVGAEVVIWRDTRPPQHLGLGGGQRDEE